MGGIITLTKRIRTRNGEPMMFATLADLEGTVEMLLFGKALAEHEATLVVDEVVIVRGRVDHKEAGKTCVVVAEVQPFRPSEEEIAGARQSHDAVQAAPPPPPATVCLQLDAARLGASVVEELKEVIALFPGSVEVVLEILTSSGGRRLRLGEGYRVTHTPELRAALARVVEGRESPEALPPEPVGPPALSVAGQSAA